MFFFLEVLNLKMFLLFYFTLVPKPLRDYIEENTFTWQASYRHAMKQPALSKKAAKKNQVLALEKKISTLYFFC